MPLRLVLLVGVLLVAGCVSSSEAPALGGSDSPLATQTGDGVTPSPTAPPSGRLTLNAVGDLMLERDIITLMDENGSVYPFAAVQELLANADLTIANMEGTFTERGSAANKFYTFRTPPRHAVGLAQAGIHIVSLGNNHTMDFGLDGLEDTLAALDEAGVLHSGAGLDAARARRPVLVERNGLRLAFLSYNAVQEATFATETSAGVARAEAGTIREDVAAARDSADLVIVSLHAGVEYTDAPSPTQRSLATAAIDAGAALVLGHHAHVLQGWQDYGEGVIVWGLGNFVFDLDFEDLDTLGPRPFQTLVLSFDLTKDGVASVTPHPVYIDPAENRPVLPAGEILAAIEARIRQLNAALQ